MEIGGGLCVMVVLVMVHLVCHVHVHAVWCVHKKENIAYNFLSGDIVLVLWSLLVCSLTSFFVSVQCVMLVLVRTG